MTEYRHFRHRFISAFKREKLQTATPEDLRLIRSGNTCAHGGNCQLDAELYPGHSARNDFHAFRLLYGVDPAAIH